ELAELQRVCGGLEAGGRAELLPSCPPAGRRLEEPEGNGDRRARCSRNQRPIGKAEADRPRGPAVKVGKPCTHPPPCHSLPPNAPAYRPFRIGSRSALPRRSVIQCGSAAEVRDAPLAAMAPCSVAAQPFTQRALASSSRRAIRAPSVGCSSRVSASHSLRGTAKKSPP